MKPGGQVMTLHPDHLTDLRRSGLTDETIAAASIESVRPEELKRLLPPSLHAVQSALLFPYPGTDFFRLKLFPPVKTNDGTRRYHQTAGSPPKLYFTKTTLKVLVDPRFDLFITEGEKKALAAAQIGLPSIGLGGLWSWRLNDKPMPDLNLIDWVDRNVAITPDSDVWTRLDLLQPVFALAKELESRGAKIMVIKIPADPDGGKMGLDDFLVAERAAGRNAKESFLKLSSLSLKHKAFTKTREWWKDWSQKKPGLSEKPETRGPLPNGEKLLEELIAALKRFLVVGDHEKLALGLWIIHTHAFEACETTPYIWITSPTKRSGKTRLEEVLEKLVARPKMAANMSVAALFRAVPKYHPTLLLDEVQAFLDRDDELAGLLCSGYKRSGSVLRCIEKGEDVQDFSTFCAKIFTSIGDLRHDAITDRSIKIQMRRRKKSEIVQKFRLKKAAPLLSPLRDQASDWAFYKMGELEKLEPSIPDELNDRAGEVWEPLFAIADLIGGLWPAHAREAALHLSGPELDDDGDIARILVEDLYTIFKSADTDFLPTKKILEALAKIEERPWATWARGGPITAHGLAKRLKPFGIRSTTGRVREETPKGYRRSDFDDTFSRILQKEPQHTATAHGINHLQQNLDPQQNADFFRNATEKPAPGADCRGVAQEPLDLGEELQKIADCYLEAHYPGGLKDLGKREARVRKRLQDTWNVPESFEEVRESIRAI